jgi:hypothetical protein
VTLISIRILSTRRSSCLVDEPITLVPISTIKRRWCPIPVARGALRRRFHRCRDNGGCLSKPEGGMRPVTFWQNGEKILNLYQ